MKATGSERDVIASLSYHPLLLLAATAIANRETSTITDIPQLPVAAHHREHVVTLGFGTISNCVWSCHGFSSRIATATARCRDAETCISLSVATSINSASLLSHTRTQVATGDPTAMYSGVQDSAGSGTGTLNPALLNSGMCRDCNYCALRARAPATAPGTEVSSFPRAGAIRRAHTRS